MARYLDPKADVVFKKVFAKNPHLLKSFLNAVLPLPAENKIAELEYLPGKQIPHLPAYKHTIADIKCRDLYDRGFIVEIQIDWTDSFQRLLFSTSQAIVKQLENGEAYSTLQPVYGLGIVADNTLEIESPDWYHHYQLANFGNSNSKPTKHLQLILIELQKFTAQPSEDKNLRLLWLRFLREINDKTVIISQELLDVPEIAEAISIAESENYSLAELNAYEAYWEAVKAEKTQMIGTFDEGRALGEAIGEARGKVEGKMEMAEAMLLQGIPLEVVANVSVAATQSAVKKNKNKKKNNNTVKDKTAHIKK